MKAAFVAVVLAAILAMPASVVLAQAPPPVTQSSPAVSSSDERIAPYLKAIQDANDPSTVVAEFANGSAVDPGNVKLLQAYVHKLVSMGIPEMASFQASQVAKAMPNDGVAWGVLAYNNAKRGQMEAALDQIGWAAKVSPDDTFVARTAGELIAFYDQNSADLTMNDTRRGMIEQTRQRLAKSAQFTDAYSAAKAAFAEEAQSSAPAPETPAAQAAPAPGGEAYAPAPYGGEAQGQAVAQPPDVNVYVTPSDMSGYNYYYPSYSPDFAYYPTYGATYPWWFSVGTFGGPIFFPGFIDSDDFFFHHGRHFNHFDRDEFHHIAFPGHHDRTVVRNGRATREHSNQVAIRDPRTSSTRSIVTNRTRAGTQTTVTPRTTIATPRNRTLTTNTPRMNTNTPRFNTNVPRSSPRVMSTPRMSSPRVSAPMRSAPAVSRGPTGGGVRMGGGGGGGHGGHR